MRGTPFLKSGFTGGLNTIASPYSLGANECRECLNVVSTANGAIQKRTGSRIFTTGPFPALAVTDKLERVEAELDNAGKYSTVPKFSPNRGEDTATGWRGKAKGTIKPGRAAYWNVAEQNNPAVSIEYNNVSGGQAVLACVQSATGFCYSLYASFEGAVLKRTDETGDTILGEKALNKGGEFDWTGYSIGITVRSNKVKAWAKPPAGNWELVYSVTDSTFKKGYGGFASGGTGRIKNFSIGEFTETALPEVISIAPVSVSSGRYMIAQAGTKVYSVNEAGEYTEIGSGFTEGAAFCIVQAPESTGVAAQGPVYLMNGVDKPQYWTGVAKGTPLVEWTGVAATAKLVDGVLAKSDNTVTSETAKFTEDDVGLNIVFTTEVKAKTNERESVGFKIVEAEILEVESAKKVRVVLPENAFWETEFTAVHFEIFREFYENATSKKHVPNGKYMIFTGNRIWVSGIADDPSAVRFSDFAVVPEGGEQSDPSAWPKNNMVRFDHSDGLPITGIGGVGPYIGVFKQRKTWMIHDLNTGENRRLSDQIGCVAHKSIVNTAVGTFFLTADQGVYLTNGSTLHELSYNVRPTILNATDASLQMAAGAYWNNHYYLSFAHAGGLKPNLTLDYDVYLKSWWAHDIAPRAWCVYEPNAGESTLFGTQTNSSNGAVVKMFVEGLYTDSGEKFKGNGVLGAYWISPWEPFAYYIFRHRIEAPFLKKRLRSIFFDGSGEIIPLVFKNFGLAGVQSAGAVGAEPQSSPTFPINFEEGETTFANTDEEQLFTGETYKGVQMIFGGAAQTQAARIYSPGVARVWGVGFGNNSEQPFEVDSFTYFAQFRKS